MGGVLEGTIGRPAVPDQGPGERRIEDHAGILIATAVHDAVDRDLRGDERPEPLQLTADFPAGLIGGDDGSGLERFDEGVVGRHEGIGDAIQGLAQA